METYLIQGEKSVTSMTSAQEDASHSANSLVQRSEHPSPPEHARFLDLKPLPHSEEQSDHSDQGENLIPDPGTMLLETKAADVFGQFGRLLQNWLSTSCPTQTRPPNAGAGFPQFLLLLLMPRSHDLEQALHSDQVVHWPCWVQLVTSRSRPSQPDPPLAGEGLSHFRFLQTQ